MPARRPLQDLPLEHFLLANSNIPSRKRPLSPGAPHLFSPAKRRILHEEGIFSPEKTLKSPSTPARFSHVLMGPSSPARKLDFSTPKRAEESPTTPHRAPPKASAKKLAPSPEIKATATSSRGPTTEDEEMEEYFSQPSTSSFCPLPLSAHSTALRETPPPPDPQSIHYPGFVVYFDKHTSMPSVGETESPPTGVNDKEETKENFAPRRKPRKAVTAPDTNITSQLLSPQTKKRELEKLNKAKSTPTTPKKASLGETPGSPTPQRPTAKLLQGTCQQNT